jgi:hypothetical protein
MEDERVSSDEEREGREERGEKGGEEGGKGTHAVEAGSGVASANDSIWRSVKLVRREEGVGVVRVEFKEVGEKKDDGK